MVLDDMELLYLRRLVVDRMERLDHNLQKNLRMFGGLEDEIFKQRKIGNLESELQAMESIKKKLNEEIALMDLR